jgi:surfactin synthase thioesterase subunit
MPELTDDALLDELTGLVGIPFEVLRKAALLRLVLPAVRADLRRPGGGRHLRAGPLGCPIIALVGRAM